eukprot:3526217-Pleurochrysis_carterae.AAC.1
MRANSPDTEAKFQQKCIQIEGAEFRQNCMQIGGCLRQESKGIAREKSRKRAEQASHDDLPRTSDAEACNLGIARTISANLALSPPM